MWIRSVRGRGTFVTRQGAAPKIAALAEKAGRDGEPILRNLEYNYPGMGYAGVIDEFMLGDDILVAPVMKKGAMERKVVVPPGRWLADDGAEVVGPCEVTVSVPLARLPHFILMRDAAEGFCRQRPDLNGGAHIKCWRYSGRLFNNRASGYVIRNNVMSGSRDMMVEISSSIMNTDGSDSMPKVGGNVFIGRNGQRFGVLNQGAAVELKYDADGVSCLAQRYGENIFAVHAVEGDKLH